MSEQAVEERRGWASDIVWVVLYSILILLVMLFWVLYQANQGAFSWPLFYSLAPKPISRHRLEFRRMYRACVLPGGQR